MRIYRRKSTSAQTPKFKNLNSRGIQTSAAAQRPNEPPDAFAEHDAEVPESAIAFLIKGD
jgi:hypothetical protein